jgi:hypothetical protein
MTVKETLNFSAQCQGIGTNYGLFPYKLISVESLWVCKVNLATTTD